MKRLSNFSSAALQLKRCYLRQSVTKFSTLFGIWTSRNFTTKTDDQVPSTSAVIQSDIFEVAARRFARTKKRQQHLLSKQRHSANLPSMKAYCPYRSIDLDALRRNELFNSICPVIWPINNEEPTDALFMQVGALNDCPTDIHEIFVFADGMIVFWDISQDTIDRLLIEIEKYGTAPFNDRIVKEESDSMSFKLDDVTMTRVRRDVAIMACKTKSTAIDSDDNSIDFNSKEARIHRFVFSHALANSVKVGVFEEKLSQMATEGKISLIAVNKALSRGKVFFRKDAVLINLGRLTQIRHEINLRGDLLTPDIYWERSDLDSLYQNLTSYFNLRQRLKMLNEQLDYSENTLKTVDGLLAHKQSVKLEIIIILLIALEVVLALIRWYLDAQESKEMKIIINDD